MHLQADRPVAIKTFQVVLALIICQGFAMGLFFLWQGYPARLLELLP